jgi:hypothetical protein
MAIIFLYGAKANIETLADISVGLEDQFSS